MSPQTQRMRWILTDEGGFRDSWKVLDMAMMFVMTVRAMSSVARRRADGGCFHIHQHLPRLPYVPNENAPADTAGRGTFPQAVPLLRGIAFVVAKADHILEHRCARRQVVGIQELCIKEVVSLRSAVNDVATFEVSGRILRVIHTDQ